MTVVAEFTCPVETFPLGRGLSGTPEWHVEVERSVPTGGALLPFFWVWEPDAGTFEASLGDHPAIESVSVLDELPDGALFRARWNADSHGILRGIVESGATLVEASGRDDGWRFRLRAVDRSAVAAFRAYCDEHDLAVGLVRIAPLGPPPGRGTTA